MTDTTAIQRVHDFIKQAGTYYLATVEGDQPRVRPFGTIHLFEGNLYIQTGKVKSVSKQIAINPKVELCAFQNGEWVRVTATLVDDERIEAEESLLADYPSLAQRYTAGDGNNQVLFLKDVTATFSSFTKEQEIVTF